MAEQSVIWHAHFRKDQKAMTLTFTEHPGRHVADIEIFALSTCPYCNKTKAYLNEHGIEYKFIDVDTVPAAEAEEVMDVVERYNPGDSFPTIVVNGSEVIVGFNEQALDALLSGQSLNE